MVAGGQQFSDRVLRGMARWPDVPSVYHWLQLDRRGRWRMKGTPVTHPLLLDFINQHYVADTDGRYYFQNGPQKVYIDLEGAPYILSLSPDGAEPRLRAHTGAQVSRVTAAWLVDDGGFALATDLGPAELDDRDLIHLEQLLLLPAEGDTADALQAVADGLEDVQLRFGFRDSAVPVGFVSREQLGERLGFIATPAPDADETEYCD